MSKYTRTPLCRITKITQKIQNLQEKLNREIPDTVRKKTEAKLRIRKAALKHYCKLYIWAAH